MWICVDSIFRNCARKIVTGNASHILPFLLRNFGRPNRTLEENGMINLNKFSSINGESNVEGGGEEEGDSSSDDDDMIEALKEATDSQFLNETLFDRKNDDENCIKEDEKTTPKKSLRRDVEFVEESNDFGVTQNFKDFVAKQLAKSLDSFVEEVSGPSDEKKTKKKKKKKRKNGENSSAGIKLMSNSEVTLIELENEEEDNSVHNKKRGKRLKTEEKSEEIISKCREVAVEPDWVLSKSSTSVWSDRTKGALYKYKKSRNGALTEID